MIVKWAILDETGVYPINAGSSKSVPDNAIQTPDEIHPLQLIRMMLVDSAWVDRPTLPDPSFDAGMSFQNLPAGTEVAVIDMEIGETLAVLTPEPDGSLQIDLPDAGKYQIDMQPPRPWLPNTFEVTVP